MSIIGDFCIYFFELKMISNATKNLTEIHIDLKDMHLRTIMWCIS